MTLQEKLAQVREKLWRIANPHYTTDDDKSVMIAIAKDALIIAKEIEAELPVWRPIESAPKDRTEVLVYQNGQVREAGYVYGIAGGYWGSNTARGSCPEPTHWMPLPSSPKQESSLPATTESDDEAFNTWNNTDHPHLTHNRKIAWQAACRHKDAQHRREVQFLNNALYNQDEAHRQKVRELVGMIKSITHRVTEHKNGYDEDAVDVEELIPLINKHFGV